MQGNQTLARSTRVGHINLPGEEASGHSITACNFIIMLIANNSSLNLGLKN